MGDRGQAMPFDRTDRDDEETELWETTLGGLYLNYVLLFAPSSPP
jgi:hypothetical protein